MFPSVIPIIVCDRKRLGLIKWLCNVMIIENKHQKLMIQK